MFFPQRRSDKGPPPSYFHFPTNSLLLLLPLSYSSCAVIISIARYKSFFHHQLNHTPHSPEQSRHPSRFILYPTLFSLPTTQPPTTTMPGPGFNTSFSMFHPSQQQQHAVYSDLRTMVGTGGSSPTRNDLPPTYREATRSSTSDSQGSISRRLSLTVGRRR